VTIFDQLQPACSSDDIFFNF